MATISALASMAKSGVQPRAIQAGVVSVTSVYSLSATMTAGDVIDLVKLPDGARIIDVIVSAFDGDAGASTIFNVGTPASTTAFIKSASANVATPQHINTAAGTGTLIDVSDDTAAAQPWTWLRMTCTTSGTGTKSGAVSVTVLYSMDKSTGY